jgi:hypothetical protein
MIPKSSCLLWFDIPNSKPTSARRMMPNLYNGNLPWNSACQRACRSGWIAATDWPRRYHLINQSQRMTKACLLGHSSFHASPCLWREAASSFHQRNIPLRRRLTTKAFEVRESRERNVVVHCDKSPVTPANMSTKRKTRRTDDSF